jgi:hypothetical protein
MHFGKFSSGSIQIDDETYEHDVVIDRGKMHQRKKQPSKNFARTLGTRRFPGGKVTLEIPATCYRDRGLWELA